MIKTYTNGIIQTYKLIIDGSPGISFALCFVKMQYRQSSRKLTSFVHVALNSVLLCLQISRIHFIISIQFFIQLETFYIERSP